MICAVLLAITCVGLVAEMAMAAEKLQNRSTTTRNGLPKKNCRQKGLQDWRRRQGCRGRWIQAMLGITTDIRFRKVVRMKRRSMRMQKHIFRIWKRIMTVRSENLEAKNSAWIQTKIGISLNKMVICPTILTIIRVNCISSITSETKLWITAILRKGRFGFLKFAMNSTPILMNTNSNCLLKMQTPHITEFTRTFTKWDEANI